MVEGQAEDMVEEDTMTEVDLEEVVVVDSAVVIVTGKIWRFPHEYCPIKSKFKTKASMIRATCSSLLQYS